MSDFPVYVGKMDTFHSQFKLNGAPVEITPNDWTPDFSWRRSDAAKKENFLTHSLLP